jgi:hypothetical protein
LLAVFSGCQPLPEPVGVRRRFSAPLGTFWHFAALFSNFQQLFDAAVGEVIPGPAPKPFSIADAAGTIQ